ncbi:interactor of constitutive active ROPs 2 chloroplastic-like, partial [Trifolium medium]|nr:interactor of constitutive active ROPs 2 chloroplastic-like [Trifolium medium]
TSASEMSQRKSPAATPRTARQLKTPNSGSNSASSSPNPIRKMPKDMSPKVNERRLSHSPISEVFEISSWLDLNYPTLIRPVLYHVCGYWQTP